MILSLLGLLIGVTTGAYTAKRKGGNKLDMAQYAAGFGLLFCVIGLFLSIILARSALA